MLNEPETFLKSFESARIAVVGDVMIDRYWWGSVSRISPEAPVPVVSLERTSVSLGGAANVAANIAGLGARALLFGITGEDEDAALFPAILEEKGIDRYLMPLASRATTIKTRIIAHHQQVTRIDRETRDPISDYEAAAALERIGPMLEGADAVVVSDYAKGLLTDRLMTGLITMAADRGIPVLVDPKGRDYAKYRGATVLTPNQKEAAEACGLDEGLADLPVRAGERLIGELGLGALLVTQGEKGMTLVEKDGRVSHMPAAARNVYDVTGAGDTVIASLAVGLAGGLELRRAAEIANLAAGIVVEQLGTTAISRELLRKAFG